MTDKNGFEIERKFLIKFPDTEKLSAIDGCKIMKISQTYLSDDSRIRKIEQDGRTFYIKTVKKHITDLKREEREWEISEEEYSVGLQNKAENTNTIEKIRYAVPLFGFIYEIDVFGFWSDRAFMEVELEYEAQSFPLPEFITVIKEVTDDKRYRNSALARKIVTEPII